MRELLLAEAVVGGVAEAGHEGRGEADGGELALAGLEHCRSSLDH